MGHRINRDTVVAVALLVLCGVFFSATFDIRDMGYASIGAEVWPRLILVVLLVLSAFYLLQSLRRPPGEDKAENHGERGIGRYANALWCYALFALFLVTLPWLGMLIGGVLFVFASLTAMGERTLRAGAVHAGIAMGTIGLMWSIFTFGLRVILPEGEIFSAW